MKKRPPAPARALLTLLPQQTTKLLQLVPDFYFTRKNPFFSNRLPTAKVDLISSPALVFPLTPNSFVSVSLCISFLFAGRFKTVCASPVSCKLRTRRHVRTRLSTHAHVTAQSLNSLSRCGVGWYGFIPHQARVSFSLSPKNDALLPFEKKSESGLRVHAASVHYPCSISNYPHHLQPYQPGSPPVNLG